MKIKVVLLLTATFDPGDYSEQLKISSLEERLEDYKEALVFWSSIKDDRIAGIVLCENSGVKVDPYILKLIEDRGIEFIQFDGNDKPPNVHYGYSELGIIDYAISNSKLINKYERFIKITGRLKFGCIHNLLDHIPEELNMLIDLRTNYKTKGTYIARTQIFFSTKQFWIQNLFNRRAEMIGKYALIEDWIPTILLSVDRGNIILRFPIECYPIGRSGAFGTQFGGSGKAKSILRSWTRRILPFLWI